MFYRMKTSLLVEHLLHHSTPSLHDKITKSCAAKGLLYSEPGDLKKITDRDKTLTDELGAIAGIDFDQYLKAHQPYMSSEELKELRNQCQTVRPVRDCGIMNSLGSQSGRAAKAGEDHGQLDRTHR